MAHAFGLTACLGLQRWPQREDDNAARHNRESSIDAQLARHGQVAAAQLWESPPSRSSPGRARGRGREVEGGPGRTLPLHAPRLVQVHVHIHQARRYDGVAVVLHVRPWIPAAPRLSATALILLDPELLEKRNTTKTLVSQCEKMSRSNEPRFKQKPGALANFTAGLP